MRKKRTKRSRIRGRRTCGYGSRKKHRGKGSRGGKGRAGTGKRAGQKRTLMIRHGMELGKRGFTSLKRKEKVINLDDIQEKFGSLEEGKQLELKGYKVLSRGNLKRGFVIVADSFSKKAKEKIIKEGGKAIALKDGAKSTSK